MQERGADESRALYRTQRAETEQSQVPDRYPLLCLPLVQVGGPEKENRVSLQGTDKCLKSSQRDFPGGPVVKALRFQRRGPGFDPWLGN